MSKSGKLDSNPVWQIMNDPDFCKKCRVRDMVLLASLQKLGALSPEELGDIAREAFKRTSDQRVGKFIKALAEAMTEEAVGDIVKTIFSHCELPEVAS